MADPNQNSFADNIAGAFGAPVNRAVINTQVATSQAMNGLRSAQTEEALASATNMQREQAAQDQVISNLRDYYSTNLKMPFAQADAQARVAGNAMLAHYGTFQQVATGLNDMQSGQQQATVANPNADPNARLAAAQAIHPETQPNANVGGQLVSNFAPNAATQPTVTQTPGSIATQNNLNSEGLLHTVQANAGGFNPHAQGAGVGLTDPNQIAALSRAVQEQRLDPTRINSRTGPILAQIEMNTPGMNFNGMHADAALQSNAGFQQKAIGIEAMPTILSHMTQLGKNIGYSDNRTVGKMQQFMNGEFNDPAYSEYMAVRNDSLMKIASLMRGAGMSDQAHTAEIEAAAPTMSPLALDGWLKGQMSSLQPFYKEYGRVHHLGSTSSPAGTGPTGVPSATPGSVPGAGSGQPDFAALAAAELARRGVNTTPAGGQ